MRLLASLFVALVVMSASTANAALLNLTVTYPLVTADFLFAQYDADGGPGGTTGLFQADGFVTNWNPGTGVITLGTFGTYHIDVVVDPGTGAAISGNLSIFADLDNDTVNELVATSNAIAAWGFGVEDKFEAVFVSQGGYAPLGSLVGTIVDARHIPNFNGVDPVFTADFVSDGLKSDSFFVVPLPAASWMGLTLIGAVAAMRRRNA